MKLKNMIKFVFAIAILVSASGIAVNAQSSKMKSLANEIKEKFPEYEKLISEKCDGAKVKYDVDFASFGDNDYALQRVPSQGLNQSGWGIARYCTDSNRTNQTDPARTGALKSKVKLIRLKQVADKANKKITLLKDGTLLVEMAFHEVSGGGYYINDYQRILSDIL